MMGMGKMMVELCSVEMLLNVCKYLNYYNNFYTDGTYEFKSYIRRMLGFSDDYYIQHSINVVNMLSIHYYPPHSFSTRTNFRELLVSPSVTISKFD